MRSNLLYKMLSKLEDTQMKFEKNQNFMGKMFFHQFLPSPAIHQVAIKIRWESLFNI